MLKKYKTILSEIKEENILDEEQLATIKRAEKLEAKLFQYYQNGFSTFDDTTLPAKRTKRQTTGESKF